MRKQRKMEYEAPEMKILWLRLDKDTAGVTLSPQMEEDDEISWDTENPSSNENNAFNF